MCYPKPGPRCSSHTRKPLLAALDAKERTTLAIESKQLALQQYEADPTTDPQLVETARKQLEKEEAKLDALLPQLAEKQAAYNATPAGIEDLEKALRTANSEGDIDEATRIQEALTTAKEQRETELSAYHAAVKAGLITPKGKKNPAAEEHREEPQSLEDVPETEVEEKKWAVDPATAFKEYNASQKRIDKYNRIILNDQELTPEEQRKLIALEASAPHKAGSAEYREMSYLQRVRNNDSQLTDNERTLLQQNIETKNRYAEAMNVVAVASGAAREKELNQQRTAILKKLADEDGAVELNSYLVEAAAADIAANPSEPLPEHLTALADSLYNTDPKRYKMPGTLRRGDLEELKNSFEEPTSTVAVQRNQEREQELNQHRNAVLAVYYQQGGTDEQLKKYYFKHAVNYLRTHPDEKLPADVARKADEVYFSNHEKYGQNLSITVGQTKVRSLMDRETYKETVELIERYRKQNPFNAPEEFKDAYRTRHEIHSNPVLLNAVSAPRPTAEQVKSLPERLRIYATDKNQLKALYLRAAIQDTKIELYSILSAKAKGGFPSVYRHSLDYNLMESAQKSVSNPVSPSLAVVKSRRAELATRIRLYSKSKFDEALKDYTFRTKPSALLRFLTPNRTEAAPRPVTATAPKPSPKSAPSPLTPAQPRTGVKGNAPQTATKDPLSRAGIRRPNLSSASEASAASVTPPAPVYTPRPLPPLPTLTEALQAQLKKELNRIQRTDRPDTN